MTYPNYPKNHPLVVDNQVPAGAELPPGAPSKLEDPIPIISRGLRVGKDKFDKLPELAPGLRWVMDGEYYVGVAGRLTALPCKTSGNYRIIKSFDEVPITISSQFQGEQMVQVQDPKYPKNPKKKIWIKGPDTIWEGFEVTTTLIIRYEGICTKDCPTVPPTGTIYCA